MPQFRIQTNCPATRLQELMQSRGFRVRRFQRAPSGIVTVVYDHDEDAETDPAYLYLSGYLDAIRDTHGEGV